MFKKLNNLTSKIPIGKEKEEKANIIITPEDSGSMNGGFVVAIGNNTENVMAQKVPQPNYKKFVSVPSSFAVDVSSVSIGNEHCFFISKDNKVYFTGANKYGQFGSVTTGKADKLTLYTNQMIKITRSEAHQYHSVYWNDKGNLLICGKGGLLGFLSDENKTTPTLIPAIKDLKIQLYATGPKHSYVVDSNGLLYGWGKSDLLGVGSFTKVKKITTQTREPILIEHSAFLNFRILKIACGDEHTLALLDNGCVYGWGRGDEYQLGHGVKETRSSPILIEPLKVFDIIHLSCSAYGSALITTKKECYVWGQYGNSVINPPELIGKALHSSLIKNVEQIHQASNYNIVLTSDREIYTFGAPPTVSSQEEWYPKLHKINDPVLLYKKVTQVVASATGTYMMVYDGQAFEYKVDGINYNNKDAKTNKSALTSLPQSNYSKNMASLLSTPSKPTTTTTTTTTTTKTPTSPPNKEEKEEEFDDNL